jgi:glycosylphosphatidylinositol phospholipase D
LFYFRYVPTKDLQNIWIAYYGDDRGISQNLISSCTLMLLAGRIAEQELGAILYPVEAIVAPIFLDEIQDYFMGGVNDMAAWTQIVWDTRYT